MFDRAQFFEKLYFHELDRKQSLESNFSLPTGIIAGLFGLVGYYFTHFRFGAPEYTLKFAVEVVFLLAAAISFLLLFAAAWWCAKGVIGSEYEHLPGAETMSKYLTELHNWHRADKSRNPQQSAATDFEEFPLSSFAKCSQINWKTNFIRPEELFRAKRSTAWALFSLAVTAGSYYVDFWYDPPAIVP
jgi:hypothetical protein